MTINTALALASGLRASFSTDAGAAAIMLQGGLSADDREALSYLRNHPARWSGRPTIKTNIRSAIAVFETVQKAIG